MALTSLWRRSWRHPMNRRSFLKTVAAASCTAVLAPARAWPAAVLLCCVVASPLVAADVRVSLNDAISLVPTGYRHQLVQRLSDAEENQQQWLDAIARAKPEHREALAFLLVNMPDRDLATLKGDFLIRNVELAYEARVKSGISSA